MHPMMKCGHAANAKDSKTGKPVCVICLGIVVGADEIAPPPNLEGRVAKCSYCKNTRPSSTDLPFFTHLPHMEQDNFYCGCRGWD